MRCLAQETRWAILSSLATKEDLCVSDMVELTGKEQTNVSHHLAELRACGLVVPEQRGRHVHYQLAHERLSGLIDEVTALAEHIACTDAEACLDAGCC